jgi:hypothetical protein
MRFTPADIVSTPVLEEVYRRDQLEKFLPFDQFKNAFAVINRNPALERLRREYEGILDDRKLTPVVRQKVEDEFESKSGAIQNGEFTLVAMNSAHAAEGPADLAGKVMEDILTVWADQSRSRGVFLFDFGIYSDNILDELALSTSDYTILMDRIGLTIKRVLGNLDELTSIPGAQLVRVGDRQISTVEIAAALHDDMDFDLKEIGSLINTFSLFRDKFISESYLREQIFRLDLATRELQSRNEGIQRILENYSALGRSGAQGGDSHSGPAAAGSIVSPQLSDTFLDRMMTLSGQNTDVTFRQSLSRQMIDNQTKMVDISTERQLYQRSVDSLEKGSSSVANSKEAAVVVDRKIAELLQRIRNAVKNVGLLHKELSQQSLQPSRIYAVVQPLQQQRLSPISMRIVVLTVAFACVVYFGTILLWQGWRESQGRA